MNEQTQAIRRGDVFKLLAACFYEPDKQLMIEENLCENLVELMQDIAPSAVPAARQMADALNGQEQGQLSIDHAALFVGPFELLAAPYGSIWLENKRQVMGDSTMAVLKLYQDAGLETDVTEPPDHIAIELEFMYFLCRQEAEARSNEQNNEAERYLELQRSFFYTMLDPWIDDLCRTIRAKSQSLFFQAMAMALASFVEALRKYYHVTPKTTQ